MDIKEVKKDVIYTVIGDRLAIPKPTFEWLIEQAGKVEALEKKLDELAQTSYCIICGDDATEVRQGQYYCHECCN